ncbi:MAG: rhomboid family intramembrane serine protease [Acidobacteria bacterium]|jgi:membrane associated rhomboid family serine protease|nr:MAG: rhomboid family intramembrane serine protease [Acidobacteriota bacterium]GIU83056.1 MAG: rhomboid family intramembrane serine protease [Pyrinomonadaceae bacterium]
MLPIGDDNSEIRIIPYVTYLLIATNIFVFFFLQGFGSNEAFTYAFSLVPREITTGTDLQGNFPIRVDGRVLANLHHYATPLPVYFNFLSSMFMHGNFAHLFGNMLFLWIFGDNIENHIGHLRYIIFYLICGFFASVAQILTDMDSIIPMLGASGAISGVLGGYMLLFPTNRVYVIVMRFMIQTVPAYVALGIWIAYQIILSLLTPSGAGGVAYAAHIGGFFVGLLLIKPFSIGRK